MGAAPPGRPITALGPEALSEGAFSSRRRRRRDVCPVARETSAGVVSGALMRRAAPSLKNKRPPPLPPRKIKDKERQGPAVRGKAYGNAA